jgi:hypothetical protein
MTLIVYVAQLIITWETQRLRVTKQVRADRATTIHDAYFTLARGLPTLFPASALARYESFLIQNVSTISSLESTLRSVTWLLPGRFKDAELVSEACQFVPPFPYHPFLDFAYISVCFSQCLKLVPRHSARQGN